MLMRWLARCLTKLLFPVLRLFISDRKLVGPERYTVDLYYCAAAGQNSSIFDELSIVIFGLQEDLTIPLVRLSPHSFKATFLLAPCASALGEITITIRTASGGEIVRFCTTITRETVAHVEFVPPESIECTEVGLLALYASPATTYSSMEIPDNHGTDIAANDRPEVDPRFPSLLNEVGDCLMKDYLKTRSEDTLNKCVLVYTSSVHLSSIDNSNYGAYIWDAGHAFLERFKLHRRDLIDISAAITHFQKGVEYKAERGANLPRCLMRLALAFLDRFKLMEDPIDITNAISVLQRAIILISNTPEDQPFRVFLLTNLANALWGRFKHSKDVTDLHDAISNQRSAVDLTPPGHVEMPELLKNLGLYLYWCFQETKTISDVDNAIACFKKAIEVIPLVLGSAESGTDLHTVLENLGNSFFSRFECTKNRDDIVSAISAFHQAASCDIKPSSSTSLEQLVGPAETAPYTPSGLNPMQPMNSSTMPDNLTAVYRKKIHSQVQASLLTTTAVAAAIRDGETGIALELMEQNRSIICNADFEPVILPDPNRNVDYRAEFVSLVARAKRASDSRASGSYHGTKVEVEIVDNEPHATIQLPDMWDRVAKDPNSLKFPMILHPPNSSNLLARLPQEGPVVIFNIDKERCDALALLNGADKPLNIPLTTFSLQRAIQLRDNLHESLLHHGVRRIKQCRDSSTENGLTLHEILSDLWLRVVKPILDGLGYYSVPVNRNRIWWCPTGPLVSLPIHAAGVYGQGKKPGSCISDFVVSSYTPNISTLLDKFEQKPNSETSSRVLILSQPNTPGLRAIRGARSETHALRDRLRGKGIEALLLEDDHATVSRVTEEMSKHNWIHFAGHAVQDQGNPLRSGIILHDERLDFAGLFTTEKMPYAAHAFLSACQTSTGDQRMPDEGLHLASAMLVVGYRSVVATMWSIRDKDAPSIADEFYARLLMDGSARGQLDEANSARALDEAVRKVRDELKDTEDGLLTWLPYAHFGV